MCDAFESYLGSPARRRLLRAAPGSLAWALAGALWATRAWPARSR